MPQAASAHDTFWDFVSLMPEIDAHADVGHVGPRHPAQLPHDAGLRRAHLPARQRRGRVALRASSTGSRSSARIRWCGTRRVKISRRRSRLPPARPVGSDRGGRRIPEWELGAAGLHRGAGRARSASTCSTRPRSSPRSWCRSSRSAGWCSNRNPGQLLRRDRAGGVLHRRTSCRASTSRNDPLLQGRIHSYVDTQITRLGGPNFHEIPINAPVAQVHNNQRDGMHRQAITARPRRLRAQLARRRLSVPGRRARASCRSREPVDGRQGARQAGEVRRPLHARRRCSGTARRDREDAHRRGLPLRADQGAGAGDPRARGRDARQRRRRTWRRASPTASASPCRRRCRACSRTPLERQR